MTKNWNKLYYVLSTAPLLMDGERAKVCGLSVQCGINLWCTLVMVPHNYKSMRVMESFEHEGAFSCAFVTFVQVGGGAR